LFIVKKNFKDDADDLINTAVKFIDEKNITDTIEDRDTSILIFLSEFIVSRVQTDYISYKDICSAYNSNEGMDIKNRYAMNSRTLSRTLKRLKVVVGSIHMPTGNEVILDFNKIKSKCEMLGLKVKTEEKQETLSEA
jgi:hypothetical protein